MKVVMKNEKTSQRIAKIAARVASVDAAWNSHRLVLVTDKQAEAIENLVGRPLLSLGTVEEVKSLAASALTQAADKEKR